MSMPARIFPGNQLSQSKLILVNALILKGSEDELASEKERACLEKIEEALLEYVERYGLTEKARSALVQSDKLRRGNANLPPVFPPQADGE